MIILRFINDSKHTVYIGSEKGSRKGAVCRPYCDASICYPESGTIDFWSDIKPLKKKKTVKKKK